MPGRASVIGVVVALTTVFGCRRPHELPARRFASSAVVAEVAAPSGLLFEGVVRRPADVWQHMRSLAGGTVELMPTDLSLAVTTLIGASPLFAGLIDESSPLAVAAVAGGSTGAKVVVAFHLTSGSEWIVALANGADAKFVIDDVVAHGLTFLRAKGAPSAVSFAVAGDYLLLAKDDESVRLGGSYLARAVAPRVAPGDGLDLVVPKSALSGPLATSVRAWTTELIQRFQAEDVRKRAEHGGRAPDFGEPAAVIGAVSAVFDDLEAVLDSAKALRVHASLLDDAPVVRVELEPEAGGAAHELAEGLDTGDLSPMLRLPSWTEAAVLFHRAARTDGGPSITARLDGFFGQRLGPAERGRLVRWADEVDRGLGGIVTLGVFGDETAVGAFVSAAGGDGNALGTATTDLVELAKVRALTAPLGSYADRWVVARAAAHDGPLARTARIHVAVTPPSRDLDRASAPWAFDVVSASASQNAAVVAATTGADTRLADLLRPGAGAELLGSDPVVARAAVRIGARATLAAVVRVSDGEKTDRAVLTIGSDRRVVWAELGFCDTALRALARAWQQP